jgi:predicted nucleotidyltransferase
MINRINKKKLIPDSLNNEITNGINAITYNINNVVFAGSFIRKSMRDSSDIDIAEDFKNASDKTCASHIQDIIKKLLKTDYIILDIKSGIDPLYINLFKKLGTISNHKVINYDYQNTLNDINLISKYIPKDTYKDLIKSIKKNFEIKQYFEFREKIRKLITLRWTPKEILEGYKIIRNDKLYLYQAVSLFLTKIDIAFICNGFYTEMSNVFLIKSASKQGLVFLPLSPNPKYYGEAIRYNLEEYLTSGYYLKALKRVYTLAQTDNDNKLMLKIQPILTSNVGILNKANSIIKTIISIVENGYKVDMEEIKFQLDNLKLLISNIYEFNFGEKNIDKTIDDINKKFNLSSLEKLSDKLTDTINTETHNIINEYKIHIPDTYFL